LAKASCFSVIHRTLWYINNESSKSNLINFATNNLIIKKKKTVSLDEIYELDFEFKLAIRDFLIFLKTYKFNHVLRVSSKCVPSNSKIKCLHCLKIEKKRE
jgi:hypothetical protein